MERKIHRMKHKQAKLSKKMLENFQINKNNGKEKHGKLFSS